MAYGCHAPATRLCLSANRAIVHGDLIHSACVRACVRACCCVRAVAYVLLTSCLAPVYTSPAGAAGGTIFPMGVTQGASWNTTMVHHIGKAIAVEARAWGGDRGLSPEINVVTDPRFGRTEENFGEDPALVEAMAGATLQIPTPPPAAT